MGKTEEEIIAIEVEDMRKASETCRDQMESIFNEFKLKILKEVELASEQNKAKEA